jgi:CBS domain-containing protein
MTQMVITVKEDAPIMECIDYMLKHNVKRIPVLNNGNKVIGMLYERDIFNFITDAI